MVGSVVQAMNTLTALAVWLFCIASGGDCDFVPQARITSYSPELGGINCQEPCDKTGYLLPLQYGRGAACGLVWDWGTPVYSDVVGDWRFCDDHGGAITNERLDVLVRGDTIGFYGYGDTAWVKDVSEPAPLRMLRWRPVVENSYEGHKNCVVCIDGICLGQGREKR